MVTIYNFFSGISTVLTQFVWFILGYALAKLGLLKTAGLFGLFFFIHWLWNHQSVLSKVIVTVTGGEG